MNYPVESFSWKVLTDNVEVKHMDKSTFLHHGTGIPQDIAFFFNLDKSQLVSKLKRGRERAKMDRGKCVGRIYHYGEACEQERAVIKRITYMRRLSRCQRQRMSFQKIADVLNNERI
ncbi:MAG: hypothetical protein GY797_35910 [Deltaproteobacteria bacterium]|nr:hypothetical protein [Deltaproteobacteria bacterium]